MALLQVQSKQCSTCIYRVESPLDVAKLEAQCADPRMEGFFEKFRECHHAKRGSGVCCRGFWNRHKDRFTLGQLAQRLDSVEYVDSEVLCLEEKSTKRSKGKKS